MRDLKENPAQFLDEIRRDPHTTDDVDKNSTAPAVAAWVQIRDLAERMPTETQDLLFDAAKGIEGL